MEFSSRKMEISGLRRYYGTAIRPVLVEEVVPKFATSTALSTLEARVAALEAYHTT